MIKLNLLGQKKPLKLPVVAGMDLNLLNLKMIVVFFLIYYFVPDNFIYNQFENQQGALNEKIAAKDKELRTLKKKKREFGPVQKQLNELNWKMKLFKERSEQIKKLVSYRTNPLKVLERLARNTPEDLWIEELMISESNAITIIGRSVSFKSIGNFVTLANESIFFNKSLALDSSVSENDPEQKNGKRVEFFTINGQIASFGDLGQ